MSNVVITNYIFKKGAYSGIPATHIIVEDDKYTKEDHNMAIEYAVKAGYKNVAVNGNITKNPILKETVQGLTAKNFIVTFVTDETDNIGPLRMFRNIRFILNVTPPTPQSNTVNPVNFPLLKSDDEICFLISTKQHYEDVKEFIKGKAITQPTVLFILLAAQFQNVNDIHDLEEQFLSDSAKVFKFKTRLQIY